MTEDTVLITIDCLRSDHLSCYGYSRQTSPNIDSLSSDSLQYERSYSNGPGTRFAFRSLLGGVYPLRLSGAGLPESEGTTLAEAFSEAGYQTAGFANNPFLTTYFGYDRGFDVFRDVEYWESTQDGKSKALGGMNRFASKISEQLSNGWAYRTLKRFYGSFVRYFESTGSGVGTTDRDVVEAATEWWKTADDSSPRFLWVHFMGVHHPYTYHPDHRNALQIDDDVPHVRNPTNIVEQGEQPAQSIIDAYDSNIRATDELVGDLLETVEGANVALTGDHGEEFGLHGEFHEASTYDSMSKVPLLLSSERLEKGTTEQLVSHVDIPPTLSHLAGIEYPDSWDGVNIIVEDKEKLYLGFESPAKVEGAIVTDIWKYISIRDEVDSLELEHLYNLNDEPSETDDLSHSTPETVKQFRSEWENHANQLFSNRLDSIRPMWDSEQDLDETVRNEEVDSVEKNIEERLEHLGYK